MANYKSLAQSITTLAGLTSVMFKAIINSKVMAKNAIVKSRRGPGRLLLAVNVFLILGLAVFGGYYFMKYRDLRQNPPSSEELAKAESDRIIHEVSKLYALPNDEEPSIATVRDKDQLKDQPFFEKAENGDITLIYSKARLAILYRPSSKQIVNVSTVTIQDNLVIRIIGKQSNRDSVKKMLEDANITYEEGGRAKGEYANIIIVDLKGQFGEQAQQLAATLNGRAGQLPAGEDKPDDSVDILIIASVNAANEE